MDCDVQTGLLKAMTDVDKQQLTLSTFCCFMIMIKLWILMPEWRITESFGMNNLSSVAC
jgi:hypothetical protein